MTQDSEGTPVSIFGIIVVGLVGGLVIGLVVNPAYTLQGFFLGFAGGALITASFYFYSTSKSRSPK